MSDEDKHDLPEIDEDSRETAPTITAVFRHLRSMEAGVYARLDKTVGRLEEMNGRLETVIGRLDKTDGRLETVIGRLDKTDGRLEEMNGRLDKTDGRLEEMNGRLERIETRLDKTDTRLDEVESRLVREMAEGFKKLGYKLKALKYEGAGPGS